MMCEILIRLPIERQGVNKFVQWASGKCLLADPSFQYLDEIINSASSSDESISQAGETIQKLLNERIGKNDRML